MKPQLILIIILLILGNIQVSSGLTIDEELSYTSSVERIIDYLEQHAIYDEELLKGWPYRLNSTIKGDDRWYRGYTAGMAGIGDFLLDALDNGINQSNKLLDEIIYHYMNDYYESNVEGIYWGRFAQENTNGWLGIRYGTSGILKFLIHAYKSYYHHDSLLELIELSYTWLLDQKDDEGWPMSPGGYITTGWEYGGVGIADAILDLYEATGNQTYLTLALEITDSILGFGTWNGSMYIIPWTPYGNNTEYEDFIASGIGVGEAGIIKFLLRINNIADSDEYSKKIIGLGNHLLNIDFGGYFPQGSVSYITRLYSDNTGLTGYYVGSSGIADIFLKLYDESNNHEFLKSAARVEKFIENFIENNSVSLGIDLDVSQFTGLTKGSSGVAYYYLSLYERYGNDRHISTAKGILDHLSEILQDGLIPIDENDHLDTLGFSFNIDEGLAGIGKIMLIAGNIQSNNLIDNYEEYYKVAVPNLTLIHTSNTSNSNYILTPIVLLVVFSLLRYVKKIRKF